MRKLVCAVAIVAAASTAAMAKELKQDQKNTAPAMTAAQMSDAEMDKVTAGDTVFVDNRGVSLNEPVGSGGQSFHRQPSQGFMNSGGRGACFLHCLP